MRKWKSVSMRDVGVIGEMGSERSSLVGVGKCFLFFIFFYEYLSGITGLMMHSLIPAVMSFTGDSLILLGGNEDSMHKGSCLPGKKSCTDPPI